MLDYWLGQCYHDLVVKKDGTLSLEIFQKRINADQSLKKQAEQRLKETEAANRSAKMAGGSRCFISEKYTEILKSVLS